MKSFNFILKGNFVATHLHFGEILHGHNFKCEAKFKFENIDFIKEKFNKLMGKIDYVHLNELEFFKENLPSTENIAVFIANQLEENGCFVKSVEVFETDNASGGIKIC